MGSKGDDPRPDKSTDGPKYPNPGESPSRPAEGGAGTGTKTDPAKQGK
jgi:hypothetical protein